MVLGCMEGSVELGLDSSCVVFLLRLFSLSSAQGLRDCLSPPISLSLFLPSIYPASLTSLSISVHSIVYTINRSCRHFPLPDLPPTSKSLMRPSIVSLRMAVLALMASSSDWRNRSRGGLVRMGRKTWKRMMRGMLGRSRYESNVVLLTIVTDTKNLDFQGQIPPLVRPSTLLSAFPLSINAPVRLLFLPT